MVIYSYHSEILHGDSWVTVNPTGSSRLEFLQIEDGGRLRFWKSIKFNV